MMKPLTPLNSIIFPHRAKSLEGINLKKEWQLTYDVLPEILRDQDTSIASKFISSCEASTDKFKTTSIDKSYIAVYSARTDTNNK